MWVHYSLSNKKNEQSGSRNQRKELEIRPTEMMTISGKLSMKMEKSLYFVVETPTSVKLKG